MPIHNNVPQRKEAEMPLPKFKASTRREQILERALVIRCTTDDLNHKLSEMTMKFTEAQQFTRFVDTITEQLHIIDHILVEEANGEAYFHDYLRRSDYSNVERERDESDPSRPDSGQANAGDRSSDERS